MVGKSNTQWSQVCGKTYTKCCTPCCIPGPKGATGATGATGPAGTGGNLPVPDPANEGQYLRWTGVAWSPDALTNISIGADTSTTFAAPLVVGNVSLGIEAGLGQNALATAAVSSVSIGFEAGKETKIGFGGNVTIGHQAGGFQQEAAIAIGAFAANEFGGSLGIQGEYAIAIGLEAGHGNTGNNAIAIGQGSGIGSLGETIAIGSGTGSGGQDDGAIAIGSGAGSIIGSAQQGTLSIAIGSGAGQGRVGVPMGEYAICIGSSTGQTDLAGQVADNSIAIGHNAARDGLGTGSVVIAPFDLVSPPQPYTTNMFVVRNTDSQAGGRIHSGAALLPSSMYIENIRAPGTDVATTITKPAGANFLPLFWNSTTGEIIAGAAT